MADQENQREVHYVTTRSGWSSFWRWTGMIVVVLILAMVIIYVANTFLLGEKMRTDSAADNGGSTIKLELNGGDGENSSTTTQQ